MGRRRETGRELEIHVEHFTVITWLPGYIHQPWDIVCILPLKHDFHCVSFTMSSLTPHAYIVQYSIFMYMWVCVCGGGISAERDSPHYANIITSFTLLLIILFTLVVCLISLVGMIGIEIVVYINHMQVLAFMALPTRGCMVHWFGSFPHICTILPSSLILLVLLLWVQTCLLLNWNRNFYWRETIINRLLFNCCWVQCASQVVIHFKHLQYCTLHCMCMCTSHIITLRQI